MRIGVLADGECVRVGLLAHGARVRLGLCTQGVDLDLRVLDELSSLLRSVREFLGRSGLRVVRQRVSCARGAAGDLRGAGLCLLDGLRSTPEELLVARLSRTQDGGRRG